ncbi:amidase family protein [Microbacterium telephonicum]|uniref:Asp-tRNA(Asn)/Glu-tRNA(Gln) amidotransferase A subunit family amidase n=1 Tax=Microbacterium telephonicum TaxID=1714841 RepID=A0A498BWE5_9MICO|nr:amidase family protein [Microbacterium telephonicum]RLK47984.1 Asp-tRNA(Asn)/Glu-tRNA(Gln) amidotransferase A subunit family amidase [Microbacterium telephonicum]
MNRPVFTRRRVLTGTATLGILALCVTGAPAAYAEPVDAPVSAALPPFYTQLDLTGDGLVTAADLDVASAALGTTSADAAWGSVKLIDLDVDGEITVADLAALSQRMVYDDGPFDVVEATTLDMQAAMNAGVTTSVEITQSYIDRIAAYDRTVVTGATRALNSIITVSDVALKAAADADAERAANGMTSLLLGVPIALKDNYDTVDMVTTGGCGCWNDNQTSTDAFMVEGLRDAGAVILAKASLDEFAYGFASEFSSFQPVGSTLLVASPYDTSKTAGGSSGGTGAAIAANLAGIGFGTDTGGSIRVPSSYNQLVGIRPTVGLASRDGIIPLALSQDTGGPIARSVIDAAVALDAVVGVDPADAVTSRQAGLVPSSYTSELSDTALQGARIGYIPSMIGNNAATVGLWNQAKATLEAQGATLVELTAPTGFSAVLNEGSGSTNEFKHDLDQYVATHLSPKVTQRSIQQILDGGNYVTSRRSVYVQRNGVTDKVYQDWAGVEGSHTKQLAAGKVLVTKLMDDNDLDTIIYPSTNAYGTIGTNMRLSPNTGMPAVTLPMGTTGAGQGGSSVGVNLEWLGRDFAEGTLLGLAYDFEQATHYRTAPVLYPALGSAVTPLG